MKPALIKTQDVTFSLNLKNSLTKTLEVNLRSSILKPIEAIKKDISTFKGFALEYDKIIKFN